MTESQQRSGLLQPQPHPETRSATTMISSTNDNLSPWKRQARQVGLLLAGAGFMAASVAVSRRSVLRRKLEAVPRFFVSNREGAAMDSADRSFMAVQAFGLASLNVTSFGILLTGGISWAFDLCSISELRAKSQAALRRPGKSNPGEEEELKQVMDDLLSRLGMDHVKAAAQAEATAAESNGVKEAHV